MLVPVTQFMRPNGRRKELAIEIKDECKEKYDELYECGATLTAEQLMTGVVSQTITLDNFNFDIILTPGSSLEGNKEALEEMILRFNKKDCLMQIKQMEI